MKNSDIEVVRDLKMQRKKVSDYRRRADDANTILGKMRDELGQRCLMEWFHLKLNDVVKIEDATFAHDGVTQWQIVCAEARVAQRENQPHIVVWFVRTYPDGNVAMPIERIKQVWRRDSGRKFVIDWKLSNKVQSNIEREG